MSESSLSKVDQGLIQSLEDLFEEAHDSDPDLGVFPDLDFAAACRLLISAIKHVGSVKAVVRSCTLHDAFSEYVSASESGDSERLQRARSVLVVLGAL